MRAPAFTASTNWALTALRSSSVIWDTPSVDEGRVGSALLSLTAHWRWSHSLGGPFRWRHLLCALSDLDYITGSKAALTTLAENYVGLPMEIGF